MLAGSCVGPARPNSFHLGVQAETVHSQVLREFLLGSAEGSTRVALVVIKALSYLLLPPKL